MSDETRDLIRRLRAQARPPAFGKPVHSGVKPDMGRVREAMRLAGIRVKSDNLARAQIPDANMPLDIPAQRRDFGPCRFYIVDHHCGASSIGKYGSGPCCPEHTPARLNGRPETVPDPARTLAAFRKAAGLRPDQSITPLGSTIVDQRAIASGKRRSSPEAYRAAQSQC